MPRLSFWAVGVLAGWGITYEGYHHIYVPYRTSQLAVDQRWERSKMPYHDAIHAYSRLQTVIEQQLAMRSSSPLSSSASARQDTSVWYTNAEKILFFCDVQRVRALLLGLPHHLITEKDLRAKLQQLSVWEAQHCTELNFRSAPLTFSQALRSAMCFVIYLLCFRVLSPLLSVWNGSAGWQARLQHSVAVQIAEALEIKVLLTVQESESCNVSSEVARGTSYRYITLNATHWIEEVGFWACPNNPLLRHRSVSAPAPVRSEEVDDYHLKLLRGLPMMTCSSNAAPQHSGALNFVSTALRQPWCYLFWCGPSASATAYATTYAEHWRRLEARQQECLSRGGEDDEAASLMTATDVTFGYPMLSNTDQLECEVDHEAHYIPVGISGLPRVLYVDTAHAKDDVRPRRTREETYARVQQAQFARAPSAAPTMRAPADSIAAVPQTSSRLHEWQAHHGPPCWLRVWWGGVYGGGPRRSNATLHYHLGRASTVAEYASAAIAASQAAGAFTAAAASAV
ncbi:conserved hypothetical protein [Leishmania braziliensis MHOM/BR/75/M2904]|uniref:Uncharacterized protein n=2 Tax=Leishmania braziliensis TaxID=5660 RepID=A4HMA4_LEIBR|nr:conserved hypothetical protein [Leishmania braziliensis MHOM/BR/75/M2904]KAI5689151.1 hypothetical protein MNV84_07286 [Leishmania braziliensis]CAJ2480093.1 unnamed protein product [Leishmania braziliensis]CAM43288.1 conserved hypothetical protein [Leishmania braziliensis MHOM/BR/75/M2904]SYZ69357.1 hypothetical_protein [Leishmania braziliensis MHOM/BR/75/M2904]